MKSFYYNSEHPAGYAGALAVYNAVKSKGKYNVIFKQIKEWLTDQDAYSTFKSAKKKCQIPCVIVSDKDPGHSPEMSATQQESLVTYVTICNVGYQAFLTKNEFWVQNVLKSLDLVTESPRKYTVLLRYLLRKKLYLSYVLIEGYLIPW